MASNLPPELPGLSSIKTVEGLNEEDKKGSGAYGAVYRVTVDGVPGIAKRIHAILQDNQVPPADKVAARQKFAAECVLLSKLRHPNIVHFIGVHYQKGLSDLSLIMECLEMDLGYCLDTRPNIPLSIKLSILQDVAYGLLYLHTHNPPIIHRDLSANNVLLTRHMTAKIADLGVSKLLDIRKHASTKAPGTLYYMPPEALRPKPSYDSKLDNFSFGHLCLYVATQQFPDVHEVEMTASAFKNKTFQILKRGEAFTKMGTEHPLHSVTHQCLQDSPDKRPTTTELQSMMHQLCTKHPKENLEVQVLELTNQRDHILENVTRLQEENENLMLKAMTYKEHFETERKDRESTHSKMAETETRYTRQLETMAAQLQTTTAELQRHKEKLSNTEKLLQRQQQSMMSQLQQKEEELQTSYRENRQLHEDVMSKTQQVKQYKKHIDQLNDEIAGYKQKALGHKEQAMSQGGDARAQKRSLKERKTQEEAVKHLRKEQEEEMKRLQKELSQAKEEAQAKVSQVKQYKKQLDAQEAKANKLEKESHEFLLQVAYLKKENKKLQHQLEKKEEKPTKAKDIRAGRKERETIMKEEREKRKHNMSAMDMKGRTTYLEEEIAQLEEDNHCLKTQLESSDTTCVQLASKLFQAEARLNALEKQNDELWSNQKEQELKPYVEETQPIFSQHPREVEKHGSDAVAGYVDVSRKHLKTSQESDYMIIEGSQSHPEQRKQKGHNHTLAPPGAAAKHPHVHRTAPQSRDSPVNTLDPALFSKTHDYVNLPHGSEDYVYIPKVDHTQKGAPKRPLATPRLNMRQYRVASMDTDKAVTKRKSSDYASLPEILHSTEEGENDISTRIDMEIQEKATEVASSTDQDTRRNTLEGVPFDPYLKCDYCSRMFRYGEIQKYKRHVLTCMESSLLDLDIM